MRGGPNERVFEGSEKRLRQNSFSEIPAERESVQRGPSKRKKRRRKKREGERTKCLTHRTASEIPLGDAAPLGDAGAVHKVWARPILKRVLSRRTSINTVNSHL